MSKHTSSKKTTKIEDDEQGEGDELNPFSFKEFIRSKNQSSHNDGIDEVKKKVPKRGTFLVDDGCASPKNFDFREPFFMDPTPFPQSLDNEEDEEWSGTYRPSAMEEVHEFGLDSSTCSALSSVSPKKEEGAGASWLDGGYLQQGHQLGQCAGSYGGDLETFISDSNCQPSNSEGGSRSQRKVREENAQLRKHVKELLRRSETDSERIHILTEELHKRRVQEEKEAQALETMVQSVEQNLQLMTKRAVKAENNVSKLKQELLQLQEQVNSYRCENERLRAGETAALNSMKRKALLASDYLSKATRNAETSFKQLLTGAETLCLVSQLLSSIDNISEIHSEDL